MPALAAGVFAAAVMAVVPRLGYGVRMDDPAPSDQAPPAATPPIGRRTARPEAEADRERLDRWMAAVWPDLSRSRAKALVEDGRLTCEGAPLTDPSAKVRAGVEYALDMPAPTPARPKPEDLPLTILFEDAHLIVVDKRAGMAVHPAVGNWSGTLVNALLHHCAGSLSGVGGVERPGIVHRLDKETSGVMVVAKHDAAHQGLAALFADHTMEREYVAAVRGAPKPRAGMIETKLARSDKDRQKQAILPLDAGRGKHAVTHYDTRTTYGQEPDAPVGVPAAALVAARLETGRTHQIRVHLAHIGCPLLGDPVYGKQRAFRRIATAAGEELKDFRRQALHAAVLGFTHPITGAELRFETSPPKDMQRLIRFLERL